MKRRQTHQKDLILDIILGDGKHFTAEEVLDLVQQKDPSIGLATIYRNLGLFCEEGKIQKIEKDGVCIYDGNPKPHDHFVCLRCHSIEDMEDDYNASLDKRAKRSIRGTILHHSTTFEGYCESCIKQEEKTWN